MPGCSHTMLIDVTVASPFARTAMGKPGEAARLAEERAAAERQRRIDEERAEL